MGLTVDEPVQEQDPRWAYPELTPEQAHAAWPCGECGVRRDEHADQLDKTYNKYPELDITDHKFVETEDEEASSGPEGQ